MKCPKCKYITFDYLDTCPRCGKDMSAEKAKLSIFSIKPDPPPLLGSLTGDLNGSSIELKVPESIKKGAEDMRLKGEEVYDDGSELNINIDEESLAEPGEEAELELGDLASSDDEKELELDFVSDAISPEIEKGAVNEKEVGEEETGSAEGGGQESIQKEESEKDSEEGALDLGDLELKLDLDEDEDSKK